MFKKQKYAKICSFKPHRAANVARNTNGKRKIWQNN